MYIRIVKKDGDYQTEGDYINLPPNFKFEKQAFQYNWKMENKSFQNGSVVLGDGTLKSYKLELSGRLMSDDEESVTSKISNITGFCTQEENLPLRFYVIGEDKNKLSFYDGVYLEKADRNMTIYDSVEKISMSFLIPSPLRKTEEVFTNTFENVASGDVISVNVGGDFKVYPTISVTALAANSSFSLTNQSDSYLQFAVNDPSFIIGDVIVADTENNTLEKNDVNNIQYLQNAFLRLFTGENKITYKGQNNVDITISYRELLR